MTDMTVSRLGQINEAGGSFANDNALFLKVFAGEVLTAYEETCVMKELHLTRTIQHGKTASFPATWKATASYHQPGQMVIGQSIKHGERTINVDDLLIAPVFIADIDEAKNHYEVRSIYSVELGRALAYAFDDKTMQTAVLAARASATITGGNGGTQLLDGATVATTASVLKASFYDAAQALDEKDVPEHDRHGILKPAQYNLLAQDTTLVDKDYSLANGDYSRRQVLRVADIVLHKSNHVPSTNIASATTGEQNTYYGDFSDTVAVVFNRSAIGTVKLMDLAMQMTGEEFRVMYQGTLMVARYAMGHGILRPECAVEISKAS
jgi:hypothetical protein